MSIEKRLEEIGNLYSVELNKKIKSRTIEMESDNNTHYLIYNVLGISNEKGRDIDLYQNVGRFLYKYAGSMLEEMAIACYEEKYPKAQSKVKLPNTLAPKPKTVEIDCLVGNRAYEIKWRDATTDGDHITKEHTRMKVIKDAGYKPIRIMFYNPLRKQAINIQRKLEIKYNEIGGEYYAGNNAWSIIKSETGIDLHRVLVQMQRGD